VDPDGVGSAAFCPIRIILPDPDRERHQVHADPDPADQDRYQCEKVY
jgi:hypothetical protein